MDDSMDPIVIASQQRLAEDHADAVSDVVLAKILDRSGRRSSSSWGR